MSVEDQSASDVPNLKLLKSFDFIRLTTPLL
jgi:hypothetical protein